MFQKEMNDQLEDIFQQINDEISTLHVYIQLYKQIYGSKGLIEVVNESAKFFFAMNQYIFIDNIILSVARLLDPAESGNFENLSLWQLLKQVKDDENSEDDLIDRLTELLKKIQKFIASFKKHRNKRIAHLDLQRGQIKSADSLPGISEDNLDTIIRHLDKFMNEINYYYRATECDYEIVLPRQSDGSALIHQLIKGKAYQQLEDDGKIEKNYWINVYPDLP